MAKEQKKGYPVIPVRSWWMLRDKFKRTIPGQVTTTYLASVLGMTKTSATNNVMPSLRTMGLVDAAGKPTDLAIKWRDDIQYTKACETIINKVFPQELRDLAPDATVDRVGIEQWFQNTAGVGINAAAKMATLFLLLRKADAKKAAPAPGNRTRETTTERKATKTKRTKRKDADKKEHDGNGGAGFSPSLRLNIQIHISPEATPEQIDQIFESMARHLREGS